MYVVAAGSHGVCAGCFIIYLSECQRDELLKMSVPVPCAASGWLVRVSADVSTVPLCFLPCSAGQGLAQLLASLCWLLHFSS